MEEIGQSQAVNIDFRITVETKNVPLRVSSAGRKYKGGACYEVDGPLGEGKQTCWMAEGAELSTVYPKGTQSREFTAGTNLAATEGSPSRDTLWMLRARLPGPAPTALHTPMGWESEGVRTFLASAVRALGSYFEDKVRGPRYRRRRRG